MGCSLRGQTDEGGKEADTQSLCDTGSERAVPAGETAQAGWTETT